MSRGPWKPFSVETFRKVKGPEILRVLGEARRKLCLSQVSHRPPEKLPAPDRISENDDMAEAIPGDRTHFHLKVHH
jgi:hypothetical protein